VSKGFLAGVVTVVTVLGLAVPAAAQTPGPNEVEQLRMRRHLSTMESVLESAVRSGANALLRQVQLVSLDPPTLTGPPQVRGFRLGDHGLFFFDVGVPGLRPPISWQLRTMGPDPFAGPAAAQIRALVERGNAELGALQRVVDGRSLDGLMMVMRQLAELERGGRPTPRGQQFVNAANAGPAAVAPTVAPTVPDVLDDPGVVYTREIQNALIESMLVYSGPLGVADEE